MCHVQRTDQREQPQTKGNLAADKIERVQKACFLALGALTLCTSAFVAVSYEHKMLNG